jgi:beta-mannosidase
MRERMLHMQKIESVGHLASGVSHDFNNVLGAIVGYTAERHRLDELDFDPEPDARRMGDALEGIELAALHHRACRPVTMGSLFWQINDVWPGASWASIDYYGRWKALQFRARHFYAPLAIAAEHKDGATQVSLISDATVPTEAKWRVRTLDVDGKVVATREEAATLAPLSATAVATLPDATLFAGSDPARTIAVAELLVDGRVTSRVLVSAAPKTMTLPDPGLTATWEGDRLTLTATKLARALWLDFGKVEATPSDNAFDLLPGESVTVTVASKASAAALRRALSVRTLAGVAAVKS